MTILCGIFLHIHIEWWIFFKILLVPHYSVMDLNNVVRDHMQQYIKPYNKYNKNLCLLSIRKSLLKDGLPWFEVPLYEKGVQMQRAWVKEIPSEIELHFIENLKEFLILWTIILGSRVPNQRESTTPFMLFIGTYTICPMV